MNEDRQQFVGRIREQDPLKQGLKQENKGRFGE